MPNRKKVAIIMGSDSDWPVVKSACGVLKDFDVPFEAHILSAHRTPEAAAAFAKSARANGYGVILCAAGMAAHLAGAFAANTTLPVVGIPMKGGAMDGLDALLATVQMPSGFPVATVALNGAKNAAYLAVAILAVADDELAAKLDQFRADTAAALARIKSDIWYYPFPESGETSAWLYIAISIVIALTAGFTTRKIYAIISRKLSHF